MNSMPRTSPTGAAQYRKIGVHTNIDTASPHKLIQMLLDGALGKVHLARGLLEQHELAAKGEQISWAISIVDGLKGSLDLNAGGEIAANLDALYDYIMRRLVLANLDNDPAILDEVARLLSEVRAGWNGICTDPPETDPTQAR
jgi:flagellar secretion chaperone FliS